jgi:hypothetical protein
MRNLKRLLVTVVVLAVMFTELNAANRRQNLAANTQDPNATYRASGLLAKKVIVTPTRGCAGMDAKATVEASRVSDELRRNGFTEVEYCGEVGPVR